MGNNSDYKNKKKLQWTESFEQVITLFCKSIYLIGKEIVIGFRLRIIPIHYFLIWFIPAWFILYFGWDADLIEKMKLDFLYPYNRPFFYWSYAFTFLYFPFLAWGSMRAVQYQIYLRAMTIGFRDAGLITPLGRMPKVITDQALDENVRVTKFAMNGIPLSDFEKAKERLSQVFGNIEEIKQESTGIISILYSHSELPKNTEIFDVPNIQGEGRFVVGYTRSGILTAKLTDVPHLLVGGHTKSGKSTFIRLFIATLLAFNKRLQVYFIDLKYGLEARPFEGAQRFTAFITVDDAITHLKKVEETIKNRAEFLSQNGFTSIEDFYKKSTAPRWTTKIKSLDQLGRQVTVIDEASELFSAGANADINQSKSARRLAIGIAAKGRAVGIHLVVATQRPDKATVDMQLKTNLMGRLCFHMTDNPSSMTILDSVRAAYLPDQPGRAIWRCGNDQKEVQTLFLSDGSMKKVFVSRKMLEESLPLAQTGGEGEKNTKAPPPQQSEHKEVIEPTTIDQHATEGLG